MVCEECEGLGVVLDAPGNVLDGYPYWAPCPKCGGAMDEEKVEPKIVSAVGVIVTSEQGQGSDAATRIEEAMRLAVLQALDEGIPITDSETIKARMLEAHLRARKELGLEGDV